MSKITPPPPLTQDHITEGWWAPDEAPQTPREGFEAGAKFGAAARDQQWEDMLAQQELSAPVAYLVTGPYEKRAFADLGSAGSFCRGLNKGFGAEAYTVTNLYPTQPDPATKDAELLDRLRDAIAIIDGALYCGHKLNSIGEEKLNQCRAACAVIKTNPEEKRK